MSKVTMNPFAITSLAILVVLALGCASDSRSKLPDDTHKVARNIKKYVPIGTRVEDAKTVMERNRFHCIYLTNQYFYVWRGYEANRQTNGPMDYLLCSRRDRRLTGNIQYNLALPYSKGTITNIIVSRRKYDIGDL